MSEDLLKIIGIVVLVVFLLYLVSKVLKLHLNLQSSIMEGLANNGENGVAGSAGVFGNSIAEKSTVLNDSFLINKYKTDYEHVILNLDEYIDLLMLQTTLNFSAKDGASPENMALLTNLNTLHGAKASLNGVMSFIDHK
jgi:hypothetical protein